MQVNTSGLILADQVISDNDKLLTILTKDHGVIKAFAKGAKNIKNKNFSALSLLSY
ncbi:MAG: recombination protein O N-terminal domain-containing protein, partial [Clostridia bacterium]|nr:recombination protein O N-terminal domain-containing protein [Clostridia bacterium]